MRYQQNLAGRKIAVVVLGQQRWPRLQPHVQLIADAVNNAVPGSLAEVEFHQIPNMEVKPGKERPRSEMGAAFSVLGRTSRSKRIDFRSADTVKEGRWSYLQEMRYQEEIYVHHL